MLDLRACHIRGCCGNGQKIKVLCFLRNLGILLGLRSLRSTFGGFCGIIGSACNLHAIHPENEKLPLVDIEGKGMGDVHGKKILAPWCASGTLLCWVSTFLHRWVCT